MTRATDAPSVEIKQNKTQAGARLGDTQMSSPGLVLHLAPPDTRE